MTFAIYSLSIYNKERDNEVMKSGADPSSAQRLRKRLPTANKLVYDNDNFFVIGYCSTKRPSASIVSMRGSRTFHVFPPGT